MIAHSKDRRSGGGSVAAHTFKNRAAITGEVREYVDLGIIPGDETAVVPDLFRRLQHTVIITMCKLEEGAWVCGVGVVSGEFPFFGVIILSGCIRPERKRYAYP